MNETLLLNKQRLAEIFSVTPRSIGKWMAQGILPQPRHMGKFPFWERESFMKWLREEFRVGAQSEGVVRKGRPRRRRLSGDPE